MKGQMMTDASRANELKNCTFVKTVLMLIIVMYHSILAWNGTWFSSIEVPVVSVLSNFAQWLNSFHIYAFTLVSGYIFYHMKYEKGRYTKFTVFTCNKIKRLLVPYFFFTVLWALPIGFLFYRYSFAEIVKKFVLAVSPSQLWFLWMLFDVFVIFWIFSDFFKNHTVVGAVFVFFLWGCGYIGGRFIPNIFNVWTALKFVPYFWIGFKIRELGSESLKKIPEVLWVVLSVGVFVLNKFVSGLPGVTFKLISTSLQVSSQIIGSIMAFLVLQRLADICSWDNRIFHYIAKRSMGVYLIHQQIIYFLIVLLIGKFNPYIHALMNFVGSLTISLLMASVLQKHKLTRFVIGEK